ncbi:hypothetical protein BFW01_g7395 [Lasiodiplodia theobromae]|nr:hypothetical protein BFW01_g7395 [Lasiodiplodia theobromae]
MYQVELDNKIVHEQRGDIGGDSDYRECSNYEECRNDEECCVEGIALSISGECRSVGFDGLDNSTHRDMTYFDCNDKPLTPMPRVNVMFISWEDGYAKRIGLGWMALKQWSSFNWTLKDIWLK